MTAPLIQIPALGCDEGLYAPFNAALPESISTQIIIPIADRMAACTGQVLVQAPETFILMGTSFGGRVAMEVALSAPARVKALIISGAGPGPVADPAAGLKRSSRARGGEFEAVVQEMGNIISHLPGPRGHEAMDAFRAMSRKLGAENFALQSDALAHRTDISPRLSEIRCPVLCLWGDHDQFSPPDTAKKIATAVFNGSAVVLKHCGHLPMLEYPEEAAKVVGDWLQVQSHTWR